MRNSALAKPQIGTLVFKVIAFDYSGLLINDLFFTLEVVNNVFRRFYLPEIGLEEFQQEFKLPYYSIFVRRGIPKQVAIESSLQVYRERYSAYMNSIRPFDDAILCIKALAELGIKLAIVSQTPRKQLEYQLDRFNLSGHFSSILALGESAREKPDPLPLLETARRLGVRPENMLYVGDMYEDVECARKAGVCSVAVDKPEGSYHTRNRLLEARPDFIIPNLFELTNLLTVERVEVAA